MAAIWSKAQTIADATPPSRNRSVDFLRAISILVVVFGHWLMASPWRDADGDHMGHILTWAPWSHYLTWIFQIMPIFFFVGGYSNGITWDAATRDGIPYREWLFARVRRLLKPVLILIAFWPIAGWIAMQFGVEAIYVEVGSEVALVPVWFLAVYSLMVALAPVMRMLWHRFGLASLWAPVALAIVGDVLYFTDTAPWFGWTNFVTLWLAVHQLGFVWLDRRILNRAIPWLSFVGGISALICMTSFGPWPTSMIGVPGEEISNSTPPHLPLLCLAAIQFGFVLIIEKRLEAWLARGHAWTATVLISSMIMTVFLWHSTVMMLSYGVGFWFDIGLHTLPGADGWWWWHLLWTLGFLVVLLPVAGLLSRFERPRPPRPGKSSQSSEAISLAAPPTWRLIAGILLCAWGLSRLALHGITTIEGDGIDWIRVSIPFLGAALAGLYR